MTLLQIGLLEAEDAKLQPGRDIKGYFVCSVSMNSILLLLITANYFFYETSLERQIYRRVTNVRNKELEGPNTNWFK